MKYFVTGGAGFIGSNVVSALVRAGHDITVLDNLSTGYQENLADLPAVRLVEGDILHTPLGPLLEGMDGVFHLAACVGNVKSLEDPFEDASINLLGTLKVLEAVRQAKVPRLVYSSSGAIFGEPVRQPIDEDHPCNPDSPYGVSKLAGEKNCMAYSRLFGITVVCLRYFNVYGVNQRFDSYGNVIPIFAQRLYNGQPLKVYGDGEQTRDFVNVADVVQANLLAAQSPRSGVYNIGCGVPTSINQMIARLAEVLGRELDVAYEDPRKGEVRHSLADVSQASRELGYKPQVPLERGLAEYWSWFQSLQSRSSVAAS